MRENILHSKKFPYLLFQMDNKLASDLNLDGTFISATYYINTTK